MVEAPAAAFKKGDNVLRVGLVAGEASGDALGAGLIDAIRDLSLIHI